MSFKPVRSAALTTYLKRLQNPYASLQVSDGAAASEVDVLTEEQHSYISQLENPYASLAFGIEEGPRSSAPAIVLRRGEIQRTVSKAEFRRGCTGIFEQYIPAIEKGRLRTHHKAFITRNESRSPNVRFSLLSQLQKYDLSDVRGIQVRFNREREDLTDEKLKLIERKVLATER